MKEPPPIDKHAQLRLLDAVEAQPETTQADLAARVGVAVGTVNWYLKRFAADGYIHITRIGRWRWRYILTPHGITEKARLGKSFVERSMRFYREMRQTARLRLSEVRAAGFNAVRIAGEDDLADICRLTCLEQGVPVADEATLPLLRADAADVHIEWPDAVSRARE
ncbi:MAG TPA: winged helix-turn-helix transcriptional regulator [Candidatus Margulisiibacteriota bacterium]|nr:winged helix-turn-helix transcriptional regulator [Candidatus Margulisiibacteriota bacterium]